MSTDDELRARLAGLDPMAGRPVTPLTDDLKEHAMTSPTRRTPLLAGAAAAAVVVVGVTAVALSGGSPHSTKPSVAQGKKTVLQLTEPGGNAAASCMALSPESFRFAVHAFEGKATSVQGGTTSFDVTHWYKGGTQAVVTVTSEGPDTAEDGIAFEEGKTYLVAAGDTEVGPCSGSGEENADLKKLFDEAFGS